MNKDIHHSLTDWASGIPATAGPTGAADPDRLFVDPKVLAAGKFRGAKAIAGARAARAARIRTARKAGRAAETARTEITGRAAHARTGAVPAHPSPQTEVDYLFGPLSSFAAEPAETPAAARTEAAGGTGAALPGYVHDTGYTHSVRNPYAPHDGHSCRG